MTTSITLISALPTSPFQGTGNVGVVITPGVPSYFKIVGHELDKIADINWYPIDPSSVQFTTRKFILSSGTVEGTFMIMVTQNFLDISDRGGFLSIRLDTGDTISFPVITYGPVSYNSLWTSPYNGLDTG